MDGAGFEDLVRFMPLAGQQQRVARLCVRQPPADGFDPVFDDGVGRFFALQAGKKPFVYAL